MSLTTNHFSFVKKVTYGHNTSKEYMLPNNDS